MFKRGKWQIEIDEQKTKEYYASLLNYLFSNPVAQIAINN